MIRHLTADKLLLHLILFTTFTSAFVLIEPAPFEGLILFVITVSLFLGCHIYQRLHIWPILLAVIFILFNFISMLFVQHMTHGAKYLLITIYLIICWAGLSGISTYYGKRLLPFIFNGYLAGAVLSVIAGIISFQSGLLGDTFLQFGRVKGFFKDPNVFGPYLIPAALYALWNVSRFSLQKRKGWYYLLLFFLLSSGILLSFSRAAWGHYLISILIYFLFIRLNSFKRIRIISFLIIAGVPLLIYLIITTNSYDLFSDRLGLQHYDETRFSNQENAFHYMTKHPFGMGPGQSELQLTISTHSLYVRILYENGVISLFAFLAFYLACLNRSIRLQFSNNEEMNGYFVIISACLIGLLFNSIFIDTIHWRHMWLLLALPFMNGKENSK